MYQMFTPKHPLKLPLRLSGSALKVIAIISMVIDHCACFLIDSDSSLYPPMRSIGRIAFPVFAFLIAEGFAHSKNRMKYFLTILAFALVSEIPWQLLNNNDGTHNVMFTLLLGVIAIVVFDRLRENGPICFIAALLVAGFAWWVNSDYDWRGVAIVLIFYMLRQQTIRPWINDENVNRVSQSLLQVIFTFPIIVYYGATGAILAATTILLYDGTRGFIKGSVCKYSFYTFYPLHLLLLFII